MSEIKQFNIGSMRVCINITPEGILTLSLEKIDSLLDKKFPINKLKKLQLSEEEYDDYVNKVLKEKEAWVKENLSPGFYSFEFFLDSNNFKLDNS